ATLPRCLRARTHGAPCPDERWLSRVRMLPCSRPTDRNARLEVVSDPPALEARGLTRRYRQSGRTITAVEDISFSLDGARTLAVIGESGAGKSTLARMLCGLEKPTAGAVLIGGVPLQLRAGRPSPVQMVFQNPVDALSPFRSIERSMFEALPKSGS